MAIYSKHKLHASLLIKAQEGLSELFAVQTLYQNNNGAVRSMVYQTI